MSIHTFQCAKYAASTLIGGLTQQRVFTNCQILSEIGSGGVTPRVAHVRSLAPGCMGSTFHLKQALDVMGSIGAVISGANVFDLFGYAYAPLGRAGATSHKKYSIANGVLVPRVLTAEYQGTAQLSFEAQAQSTDGITAPLLKTNAQSVPTGVTDQHRYSYHSVFANDIPLPIAKSVQLDFGLSILAEGGDASIYPTIVVVQRAEPVLTLNGINQDWYDDAAITLAGLSHTHANTALNLVKRDPDGPGFLSAGSSEHVTITMNGIAYVTEPFTKQGPDGAATTAISIKLTNDGTLAPTVIVTAGAILTP